MGGDGGGGGIQLVGNSGEIRPCQFASVLCLFVFDLKILRDLNNIPLFLISSKFREIPILNLFLDLTELKDHCGA